MRTKFNCLLVGEAGQDAIGVLKTIQDFLDCGKVYEPVGCPRLVVSGDKGRRLAVELLKYSCIERKRDMLRRRFGLNG